jgi:hypothetical protein
VVGASGNEDADDVELRVCDVVIEVGSIIGVGKLEAELREELEIGVMEDSVEDGIDDELVLELAVVAVEATALHSPGISETSARRSSA